MGGMPLGPPLAALAIVIGSLVAALVAVGDAETMSTGASAQLVTVLIALGVIAASGILLARGRWARWLTWGLAVIIAVSMVAFDAGAGWRATGVAVVVVAAVAVGPGSRGWLRTRPSAQGPPPLAAALLLSLVAFPALVAVVNRDGIAPAAVVGSLLMAAAGLVYSRSGIPALWGLRVLVPLGVVLAVVASPWPEAVAVVVFGVLLIGASWARQVRQAAAPLIPLRSPGYRIPAELAPPEVLDAAGLDERGRRR